MIYRRIDTIGKLKDFIDSSKDEADYFGISKDKLISVKEYLQGLKKLQSIYSIKTREPFMEIIKNNDWISDIQPNFNYFTNSVLDIIDYKDNVITISKENGKYITRLDSKPRTEKLCRDFDSELREIETISNEFVIDGEASTASNNFSLVVQNFKTIYLRMNFENFIDNNLSYENAEQAALNYFSTFLLQNKILANSGDKLAKKLYLKK